MIDAYYEDEARQGGPIPAGPSESTEKSDLTFHPSKPHAMRPAPEFPGYLMCTKGKCPYWEFVGVEVTA